MRVNGKELGILSRHWADDCAGTLLVKERGDSLFRKTVSFSSHWCTLKGNILIILKGDVKDSVEVYGLVILENFQVDLCVEKEISYSFRIVFDADDPPIVFAAYSEQERIEWIKKLQSASILSMRERVENVRNLIHSKTGHDPLEVQGSYDDEPVEIVENEDESVRGTELCFSCTNLPPIKKGSRKYPYYCITVSIHSPNQREWNQVGKTEMESDGHPTFLKTVFIKSELVCPTTEVRLSLVNVSDVNTLRMTTIGSVTVKMEELQQLSTQEFRLSTVDGRHYSVLYVRATLKPALDINPLDEISQINMKALCDNILSKSYVFPCSSGATIDVVEYLGESNLNGTIPIEFLKQTIQKERLLYDSLNSCRVPPELEVVRAQRLASSKDYLMTYEMTLKDTCDHPGLTFRPSTRRREPELEYMPVNLHLHRTCVLNGGDSTVPIHDITTVGCFAASSKRFKNVGLMRIIEKYDNILNDTLTEKLFKVLNNGLRVKNRLEDNIQGLMSHVCTGNILTIDFHRQKLSKRYDRFKSVLGDPIFNDSVDANRIREAFDSLADILVSISNDMTDGINPACLGVLKDVHLELLTAISDVWAVANDYLWLRILKRISPMESEFDEYYHRLSIVTCQGLTATLTALMAEMSRWQDREWRQMSCCGILVLYEALLSCIGDERGMIEDMTMAIKNLRNMELHFYPSNSSSSDLPHLTSLDTVRIPCSTQIWDRIPEELRISGKLVLHWKLVFVNVGINEQQTLAERRRKVQIQENINVEAYKIIRSYFDSYCHHMGGPPKTPSHHDVCDLLSMVASDVSQEQHSTKPVHLLQYFEELAWSMNGLRLTSCKSAKDRTSMSATLEQIRWLIWRHGLTPEFLQPGIDCLRSTGLRRDNCFKNVRIRKYAFTKVQLMCFPKYYRPPPGTYGHLQT